MGRKNRRSSRPQATKRVWVEPIHRTRIDEHKLARALLDLAIAESKKENTDRKNTGGAHA